MKRYRIIESMVLMSINWPLLYDILANPPSLTIEVDADLVELAWVKGVGLGVAFLLYLLESTLG